MSTVMASAFKPVFNHTMIRVRDPSKSLNFYERICGMKLINKIDFEGGRFSLYFLGFDVPAEILSAAEDSRRAYSMSTPGILELTHNWGTESDESFAGYSSGNSDPGRGFGHIALSVEDVDGFCAYLDSNGVSFKKKPNEGSMKGIAFALDPDGYWVEIVPNRKALKF